MVSTTSKCQLYVNRLFIIAYILLLNSSILDIKGICSAGGLRKLQQHFTPTVYLCRNDCMIDTNRCKSRCTVNTRTRKTRCKYGCLPKQCKVCCDDVGDDDLDTPLMTDVAQEQEVETVLTNVLDDIDSVKALPQDMAGRFMKVGRDAYISMASGPTRSVDLAICLNESNLIVETTATALGYPEGGSNCFFIEFTSSPFAADLDFKHHCVCSDPTPVGWKGGMDCTCFDTETTFQVSFKTGVFAESESGDD